MNTLINFGKSEESPREIDSNRKCVAIQKTCKIPVAKATEQKPSRPGSTGISVSRHKHHARSDIGGRGKWADGFFPEVGV